MLMVGSPAHLFAAKEELEKAWKDRTNTCTKTTTTTEIRGPDEDPTISTNLKADPAPSPAGERTSTSPLSAHAEGETGEEELVVVIAGGMTSQLTYDGIDVCASRVAWEVRSTVEILG